MCHTWFCLLCVHSQHVCARPEAESEPEGPAESDPGCEDSQGKQRHTGELPGPACYTSDGVPLFEL